MLTTEAYTPNQTAANHTATTLDKEACPNCGSLVWEQIRRTRLQKFIRFNRGRCYCRSCQNEFWKKSD